MTNPRVAEPASAKHRVFVVDDHPLTRHGLCQLLTAEADLMVCGQAAGFLPGREGIQTTHPDIVVLDIAMPGRDGIELIKDVEVHHPQLPMLVVSAMDENIYAKRALQAGAKGYVMKHEPIDRILTAVREVLAGEVYLSATMRTQLLLSSIKASHTDSTLGVRLLSDRELQVFRLIGEGFGTQNIAKTLNLSVSTVEAHRTHIKEKLSVKHARELARQAVIWRQSQDARH